MAGFDARRRDPALYEVDAGEDVQVPGCTLETNGAASLRFASLIPDERRVHFCLRPSGATADSGQRVTRGVGRDCPPGLGYQDVFAPIPVPPGDYDVTAVPWDAEDCSAQALAEGEKVTAVAGQVQSVLLLGGGAQPEQIKVFAESTVASMTSLIRVVHAAPGLEAADVGLATGEQWPATMGLAGFVNVPFGGIAAEGMTALGEVDGNGYLDFFVAGARQTFGLARSGEGDLLAMAHRAIAHYSSYTVFVVGLSEVPEYPLQLLVCSDLDNAGLMTACSEQPPMDVSFASFSAKLDGVFAVAPLERREPLLQAVAEADVDVLCLVDDYMPGDRERLAEMASSRFPFTYWVDTDTTTEIADPRDVHGQVPAAPTQPPCTGADVLTNAQKLIDCVVQNCADVPGDPESPVSDGKCIIDKCNLPAFVMLSGDERHKTCVQCLIYGVTGYNPLNEVEKACTTDPAAGRPFEGQNGEMLLSRYPLGEVEAHVLPSSAWRVVALRAPVLLPNDAEVDAYCVNLETATRSPGTQPYTGPYGDGPLGPEWANEVLLEADRLVVWMRERSGPGKTVLLGELGTGPGLLGGEGQQLISPAAPEIFDSLRRTLAVAAPVDYVPQCTTCATNPLVGGAASAGFWTTHVLMSGVPVFRAGTPTLMFQEPVVPMVVDGKQTRVPVSEYYGLRVVLRVEP